MSITFTQDMQKAWDYLLGQIGNEYGTAGLLGNLYAESGVIANRVEVLCLKRLKEKGIAYTDKTYTAAVDTGKINRHRFLQPIEGKHYGYGLCQWTSEGRKGKLYDFVIAAKKKSIGDLEAQLAFLVHELQTSYATVWKTLQSAKTIKAASDIVLTKFEVPGTITDKTKNTRENYGKQFYGKYKGGTATVSTEYTADSLIAAAIKEDGYLEKKSASNLDSKTANAGSKNYTKYARDIGLTNGQYWCATYTCCMFKYAFGDEIAKKLLLGGYTASCEALRNRFIKAKQYKDKPAAGDLIFFSGTRHSGANHIGIVTKVSSTNVYTIEGNTSSDAGVVDNGGAVNQKSYKLTNGKILGYGRPKYTASTTKTSTSTVKTKTVTTDTAKAAAATMKSSTYNHPYTTTGKVNMRTNAGKAYDIMQVIPSGATVRCYGYFNNAYDGTVWLFVTYNKISGYVSSKYLKQS